MKQSPNQSMKPTAPWRGNFSELATDPARGLSLSSLDGSDYEYSGSSRYDRGRRFHRSVYDSIHFGLLQSISFELLFPAHHPQVARRAAFLRGAWLDLFRDGAWCGLWRNPE